MKDKYYINTYNPILNEDLNSIYLYNNKHLNIIVYNKSKIINILLNHYFNLKKKIKFNVKPMIFKHNIINKNLFINNIDIINKTNTMKLIKKQSLYISKRKNILINWKNKLILNKNLTNKDKFLNYGLSLKRIFINFPKIKHTNNNISILINIFNKEKIYLKVKLKRLKSIILTKKYINNIIINKYINNISTNNNMWDIKIMLLNILKTNLVNTLFKRNYLAKIYLNNFKFNNLNLISLKNIIYKIYNKEIYIYVTNIKYIYLDNNIFIDSLTIKLNNRKKRVLRVLKQGLHIVRLANINTNILLKTNLFLKNSIKESMLFNIIYNNIEYKNIIRNIRNIHIIGINLEAKGRLTRRMTASRSVYKIRSKGTLKNIYNYYYNISTSLIKNTLNSNISYTKNESKNRNGAFGILSKISTG
jgi:hypothetical protein